MATNTVAQTNAQIAGFFAGVTLTGVLRVIGWFVFALVLIGSAYWYFAIHSKNKKIFVDRVTAFRSNGLYWKPFYRDWARKVKIGTGGFEIHFLKKAKTWKIAYGAEGGNDYYYYVMSDGYWYNALQKAGVYWLDKAKGLIPVVTTNPLMRGQYTSLEKQIDSLTGSKQTFWDKYGTWVLSISFVLIAGIVQWLIFKEYHTALGQLSNYHKELGEILKQLANLASNLQTPEASGGLIKV